MNLDRRNMLKILGIAGAAIFFYWALENPGVLMDALSRILQIFWPLILGFCIAFVLNIPMRFLEQYLFVNAKPRGLGKIRRPISILISLILIVGLITFVFCLVVPELIGAFGILGSAVPKFLSDAQKWAIESLDRYPQVGEWLSSLQINWNETGKRLFEYLSTSAGNLLDGTVSLVSAIVGGVFNAVMAFIFGLYILLDKEKLKRQTASVFRAFLPQRLCHNLLFVAQLSSRSFANFVAGQCTEACILGTLCWLGMTLLKLPYAPMVGALVGMTALIPMVGGIIGMCVGAFMIMMVNPLQALWFIIFLLALQQVEGNLIYPRVVGSSVGLPPIWVLAAVTVAGSMFGIGGMLFAVPVCSVMHSLLRLCVQKRLLAKEGTPPAHTP